MSYRPLRTPRHETLAVRGLVQHVSRWGPRSDDPLVMLHGWADTADTFQFLVDALERDWPVAAIDWRGFGRSEWTPDGYWFPDYLGDLDVLLDALCPHGPARLVGHSMGGNIAMSYAGVRPDRVRAIANLEGIGLPRSEPAQAPERLRKWLRQLREPPEFAEYDHPGVLAQLLQRRNPRLPADRAGFIAASWTTRLADGRMRLAADPAHKRVNPYLYRRDETEAVWRCVTAPVLLVLAGRSGYLPRLGRDGDQEIFRQTIARLTIEVLPDVGHMMHHEDPLAVARVVEPFLSAAP